jgi:serine/threonine-protein kinase
MRRQGLWIVRLARYRWYWGVMRLEVGQVIDGKYRILRLIGEGGMGAVFEGENTAIRRKVAIKVLLASMASNEDLVRRFEREAQAAGEIGNDHILEVLDLGTLATGERYMVMEYLDGETLTDRIRRHGRLTPRQVAPIARQLLSGLGSAHAAGIIHRDLKPDNVFILREKAGQRDFVKLIDFGISKFSRLSTEPLNVTRVGSLMGTPCYMSPEQARGTAEADVRSDIYAVGVMLYEAVTGQLPFDGESFNDLMFKIALSDAPPPSSLSPGVDPRFEEIIMKAMARDPSQRHASVEDLKAAIDAWLANNEVLMGTSAGIGAGGTDPTSARGNPSVRRAGWGGDDTLSAPAVATPQTRVNWANSGAIASPRAGRRPAIFIAAAVAGVVLLAGGLVAVKATRPTPAEAAETTKVASPVAAAKPDSTALALAPLSTDTTVDAGGGVAIANVEPTAHRASPAHSVGRVGAGSATVRTDPTAKPATSAKPAAHGGVPDFGY